MSGTPARKRLFCVDLMRGLDIFYLLVIHYAFLAPGVFSVWPLESTAAKAFWLHSVSAFAAPGRVPTGFGLLDFTQPLFVFVTGVSASLAFRKFLGDDGRVDLAAVRRRGAHGGPHHARVDVAPVPQQRPGGEGGQVNCG